MLGPRRVEDFAAGYNTRNHGVFIAQGVAAEQVPLRSERVIDAPGVVIVVLLQDFPGVDKCAGDRIGRQRHAVHRRKRQRIQPARRDPIAGELVANAVSQRIRIEDAALGLAEIAGALQSGGDRRGSEPGGSLSYFQALEGEKSKQLVFENRTAHRSAILIALELGQVAVEIERT